MKDNYNYETLNRLKIGNIKNVLRQVKLPLNIIGKQFFVSGCFQRTNFCLSGDIISGYCFYKTDMDIDILRIGFKVNLSPLPFPIVEKQEFLEGVKIDYLCFHYEEGGLYSKRARKQWYLHLDLEDVEKYNESIGGSFQIGSDVKVKLVWV